MCILAWIAEDLPCQAFRPLFNLLLQTWVGTESARLVPLVIAATADLHTWPRRPLYCCYEMEVKYPSLISTWRMLAMRAVLLRIVS